MRLAEIWRYPVKSMGGERLTEAVIEPDGIPGDRVVHVDGQLALDCEVARPGLVKVGDPVESRPADR